MVVAELTRRRRATGQVAGRAACARAKRSRRRFAQSARLLSGFGQVVAVQADESGSEDAGWIARETANGLGRQS
jgi:hypothetical protein